MTAVFMLAIGLSNVLGNSVSGWIMVHFDGTHGWKWLFLLEGLPTLLFGIAVVRNGQLDVAKTMALRLTFDHRVVDGAPADRWLQRLCERIQAYSTCAATWHHLIAHGVSTRLSQRVCLIAVRESPRRGSFTAMLGGAMIDAES